MPIINEQEKTEAFEHEVGGPNRGFRLMRMWEDCANPVYGTWPLTPQEKANKRLENFKRKAKGERYSDKAVQMFLELQGH